MATTRTRIPGIFLTYPDSDSDRGDRPLTKKLTDFVLTGPMVVWTVSGALEVHLLALEDKLKGREAELTEEIVNATCTDGDFNEATPLYLACWSKSWESALLLLIKGADPNWSMKEKDGSTTLTPIWWAAFHGSVETVKELLNRGARQDLDSNSVSDSDSDSDGDCGEGPLGAAERGNHVEIVELLEAALATSGDGTA